MAKSAQTFCFLCLRGLSRLGERSFATLSWGLCAGGCLRAGALRGWKRGTYSSGNCSGFTPDSHLIPVTVLGCDVETIASANVVILF